jgi:malate:Na+ symporter
MTDDPSVSRVDAPPEESPSGKLEIAGIGIVLYLVMLALVLVAGYLGALPPNIVSGLAVAMLMGGLLKWVGDQIPVFSTFGGGPLLCIIVPALLLHLGMLPESLGTLTDEFYTEFGFAELAVTGIVVGSVLGMDRILLIRVGMRFFFPLVGAVALALGVGALVGYLTGFGAGRAVLFVVAPTMGGGMAAGVIPMSDIYASISGASGPAEYLAMLTPALVVANIACILLAGVLNGLGKLPRFAALSGAGQMLRTGDVHSGAKRPEATVTMRLLIVGLTVSLAVYAFGEIGSTLVPGVHTYVWIIAASAVLKIFRVLPEDVVAGAESWYAFITQAWVPAVLVAISAGLIDVNAVLEVVTNPTYVTLTVLTVIVAAAGAGLVGLLVGFYFIESSISAGLGMADMGGSGDVAVLSAANRIGLMPFLQISSRIGGAGMLVLVSIMAPLLL